MTVGMGNFPEAACSVATMSPKVAAGKMSKASAAPINGTMDKTETHAMNKKNKPVKASGWRQNVRMPCLTQTRPCLAGTICSFMTRA